MTGKGAKRLSSIRTGRDDATGGDAAARWRRRGQGRPHNDAMRAAPMRFRSTRDGSGPEALEVPVSTARLPGPSDRDLLRGIDDAGKCSFALAEHDIAKARRPA